MRIAAFAIILLAIFNINNTIALTGSKFTIENMWSGIWCTVSICDVSSAQAAGGQQPVSEANIDIESSRYNPNNITVKAGSQITLHVKNTGGYGCIQAFTIPSLGIQKVVPVGTSNDIVFAAPDSAGDIPFMCSMGMFRGVVHVI